mmetsp:Transcript_120836/g.376318  ORF Transcript_120836/g.376318 Transcript_120836/m.376318 type:complete len:214 (+) Transcript_120836:96-737(+)
MHLRSLRRCRAASTAEKMAASYADDFPARRGSRQLDLRRLDWCDEVEEVARGLQQLAQPPHGSLHLRRHVVLQLLLPGVRLRRRCRRSSNDAREACEPLPTLAQEGRNRAVLLRGNGRVVEDKGLDASLKPAAHPSSPPQAPRVALTLGARDAGLACLKDGLVGRIDDVQDLAHTLQDLSSTDSTLLRHLRPRRQLRESPRQAGHQRGCMLRH